MEEAKMPDFHEALGQDVLEEPTEQLHDVELSGARAGTAHFPGGKRDGAVRERDKAALGERDLADIGRKVRAGGMAVVIGPTVDIPGDGPDLRVDGLQETSVTHLFFEECTGDGGKGFNGAKAARSRGAPCCTVLREATARDDGVDRRVVLELPAPSMEDAGEPWQVGSDETRVCGQPLEGGGSCLKHGVVREALMRADQGT
jgi:hypothetical protein